MGQNRVHPFVFPHAGTTRTVQHQISGDTAYALVDAQYAERQFTVGAVGSSGVVKELSIVFDGDYIPNNANFGLRLYYDGESSPSVDVKPLGDIFGWTTMGTGRVATTTNGAVLITDTVVTVTSAASMVVGGYIQCEAEIMQILVIAGAVLTVVRGAKGTAVAAHATAKPVVYFAGGPLPTQGYDTEFFSVRQPPYKAVNARERASVVFRYPIPYTNGLKIGLYVSSTVSFSMWVNIRYQDVLPACWNRNLRLYLSRSTAAVAVVGGLPSAGTLFCDTSGNVTFTGLVGTFATTVVGKYLYGTRWALTNPATSDTPWNNTWDMEILARPTTTTLTVDSTHCTNFDPAYGTPYGSWTVNDSHAFLTRPAGKRGYIASIVHGFDGSSSDFGWQEGNLRFYLDQETNASYVETGWEDLFDHCFYAENGIMKGMNSGILSLDSASYSATAYRDWSMCPIRYTNGVRGVFPCLGPATSSTFVTAYYEETP